MPGRIGEIMTSVRITAKDAEALVAAAFGRAGMPERLAAPAARALVAAERDGLQSHGLARAPFYAAQMRTGKVRPAAEPEVVLDGAVVRVDAGYGLAFAAIEAGAEAARPVARALGLSEIGRASWRERVCQYV